MRGERVGRRIFEETPVPHRERPWRRGRDRLVVRHEDDALAVLMREVAQQRDDLIPGLAVEVASRLVGQDDARVIGERPGDGNPLLLAARELRG